MYQAYGLLQPTSDFTLDSAAKLLQAKLPHLQLHQSEDAIRLFTDDWEIHLVLNSSPSVKEESQEFAEKIAGLEDGGYIATCSKRVEVSSDISDPFMEHFGDYQSVIEVLQSFRGVIAIDPREPSLL